MHEETMIEIQQASKERLNLYLLASHEGLTPKQHQRLDELNVQMPLLWDRYRREYARRGRDKVVRVDTFQPDARQRAA